MRDLARTVEIGIGIRAVVAVQVCTAPEPLLTETPMRLLKAS